MCLDVDGQIGWVLGVNLVVGGPTCGWVDGGWVGIWLCFLFLFLFFCSGGFGVLLWWFWCETVVGWDVGC